MGKADTPPFYSFASPNLCQGADEPRRKKNNRGHELKRAVYSNPNKPERQQEQPNQWVQYQRYEG